MVTIRPWVNRMILKLMDDETLRRALVKEFVSTWIKNNKRG